MHERTAIVSVNYNDLFVSLSVVCRKIQWLGSQLNHYLHNAKESDSNTGEVVFQEVFNLSTVEDSPLFRDSSVIFSRQRL